MIDEIYTQFVEKQRVIAEGVVTEHLENYSHKMGRKLTDEETFAMAIMAGVPIDYNHIDRDDKYVVNMTTIPCAVAWDGTQFLVGTKATDI